MTTQISKFDIAEHLTDQDSIAGFLTACLEDGGLPLFQKAMGEVARARGMSEVAEAAGVTRASLYKSLSESGSPALNTVERVMQLLGLRLAILPAERIEPPVRVARVKSNMDELMRDRVVGVTIAAPKVRIAAGRGQFTRALESQSVQITKRTAVMAGSKSGSKGPADYRSSKTGEFVKPGFAKTHPATTEKEHNRPPPKPTKK